MVTEMVNFNVAVIVMVKLKFQVKVKVMVRVRKKFKMSIQFFSYDRDLVQSGSAGYKLTVRSSCSDPPLLEVSGLKSGGLILDKTMIR